MVWLHSPAMAGVDGKNIRDCPLSLNTTCTAISGLFDAPAGAAPAGASNSPLMAVQVVFNDKGQSLMFLPSTPAIAGLCSQTISLNVDIADYVLGRGDNSNYTYRVDTITANGTVNGPEISANLDDLFVTLGS